SVDYLSTVSGGGYIGSWLAAWIKREGSVENVEKQLRPSRLEEAAATRIGVPAGTVQEEEPEPIYHLRAYSNYLAPRLGFLSADGWVLIALYLRNFLLTQLLLLPSVATVLLLTRFLVVFYRWKADPKGSTILGAVMVAL